MYAAPAVQPGFRNTFALAAVAAQGIPTACAAGLRDGQRFREESLFPLAREHSTERIVGNAAELPSVQRVEIAGIDASVAFDDEARTAAPDHRAVFRRHAHEHGNPVVKIADGDGSSLGVSQMVAVKGFLQKGEIGFAVQGVIPRLPVKAVETGDELDVFIRSERIKDLGRTLGHFAVDDAQHVDAYAGLTQALNGLADDRTR